MSQYVVLPIDPQTHKYSLNISLGDFPADRRPYKQLTVCDTDPVYRVDREDETMLCMRLFNISMYLTDEMLQIDHCSGPRSGSRIIFSKTSIAGQIQYLFPPRQPRLRSASPTSSKSAKDKTLRFPN